MKQYRIYHTGIVLMVLGLTTGKLSSQQLTPFVISPSGGFYQNASGLLSFTIGEMSAIETFTSPSIILTQGFQQVWDIETSITDPSGSAFSVNIYPNPNQGYFNLMTESEWRGQLEVKIVDLMGRNAWSSVFSQESHRHVQFIDLSDTPQGFYVVTLSLLSQETGNTPDHSIGKIQIVR